MTSPENTDIMKKRIRIWALLLAAAGSAWLMAAEAGERSLTFERDTVDMGTLDGKTPVTGRFRFRNEGAQPVGVTRVFGDCTCIRTEYPDGEIAPGGEGEISVTYSGSNRSHGPFVKMLRVGTTDSPRYRRIWIRGVVARPQKD